MSTPPQAPTRMSRRELLAMVGKAAGGAAMYQAMTALGFAAASPYSGPIRLEGAPRDVSILILGAGVAGLVAAYELRNAGYHVKVLEYNHRAGGRAWTIRGGDEYTELGGLASVASLTGVFTSIPGRGACRFITMASWTTRCG